MRGTAHKNKLYKLYHRVKKREYLRLIYLKCTQKSGVII